MPTRQSINVETQNQTWKLKPGESSCFFRSWYYWWCQSCPIWRLTSVHDARRIFTGEYHRWISQVNILPTPMILDTGSGRLVAYSLLGQTPKVPKCRETTQVQPWCISEYSTIPLLLSTHYRSIDPFITTHKWRGSCYLWPQRWCTAQKQEDTDNRMEYILANIQHILGGPHFLPHQTWQDWPEIDRFPL